MGATLDRLRDLFPGKAMLTVDDVARVLGREGDRKGREAVSAALRRGDVLPGLRKVLGRWLVRITALADWLDGLTEPLDVPGRKVGPTRRSVITKPDPVIDRPRRGRVPNRVREAERRARAQAFFGAVGVVLEGGLLTDTLHALPVSGLCSRCGRVECDGIACRRL